MGNQTILIQVMASIDLYVKKILINGLRVVKRFSNNKQFTGNIHYLKLISRVKETSKEVEKS